MLASSEEIEAYKVLLSSNPENETYYQVIVISHSLYSKTYYLVIDSNPLTATLPTGETVQFEPASIVPTNAINSNDLDQSATFTIADVKNILDSEEDRRPIGDQEIPLISYGIYHGDYLDSPAEWTVYDAKEVAQKKGLFTVKTGAPDLNQDETGEVFDYETFPMLRGLNA